MKLAQDFCVALEHVKEHDFKYLREQIMFVQMYLLLSTSDIPYAVVEHNRRLFHVMQCLLAANEAEDTDSIEYWNNQLQVLDARATELEEQHSDFLKLELN